VTTDSDLIHSKLQVQLIGSISQANCIIVVHFKTFSLTKRFGDNCWYTAGCPHEMFASFPRCVQV